MSRSDRSNRKPARMARLALRQLRRYPRQTVTLLALGLLTFLGVLLPALGAYLLGLGVFVTSAFVAFTSLRGLVHFRALVRAAPTALSWAFRLGLIVALLGAGGLPELIQRSLGVDSTPYLILYASVPLFGLLFVCLFVGGMVAAAIGLWCGRKRPDPSVVARAAIAAYWTGTIFLVLLAILLEGIVAEPVPGAYWLALVPWTVMRCTRETPSSPAGPSLSARAARLLARLRVRRAGETRILDLRGLALGAVGALASLLLTMGPGRVLAPLQFQALEGLLRLRNEPVISQPGWTPLLPDAQRSAYWRSRIVIAEMDPLTRRQARTSSSETLITARVIERLRQWHPLRITAPVPQLDPDWPAAVGSDVDVPPASVDSVRRNRQHLPELEAVLRHAPEVLLALPRFSRPDPTLRPGPKTPGQLTGFRLLRAEVRPLIDRLIRAAHETSFAGVESYGTRRLPVVRLDAREHGGQPGSEQPFQFLPAAVRLVSAALEPDGVSLDRRRTAVRIAGRRTTLMAPGLTPVDYGGFEPLQVFPHISYHSILKGERVYETELTGHPGMTTQSGRWRTAKEYFPGKIVLLTPLDEERVETPAGALTPTEIVAHATVTLASGHLIRPLPAWVSWLGVLALGISVGHVCAGATPLTVGWRGGLAVLFPLVLAPAGILFSWWIDPVAPLVAVAISIALVTQISYRHEQDDFQRHRSLLERVAAPQVVDELLARPGKLALGGERREVCILFADVRGFTQFSEGHTADQVITVINRYTTALTGVLLAHGGILDHYTGDGLVARFELLHAPEEDLRRAVFAALAMRDAAEAIAARQEREGGEPLRLGMGVHYGEAVVGLVGSLAQFNYTAMGHTVVVAARLQGLAGGGELLISDEVYRKVGADFRCEPCEPVMAKGLSEPIRAYRVLSSPSEGVPVFRSSEMGGL